MRAASRVARGVAIGAGAVAYAVLAHLSNSVPGNAALGALLAIAPLWLAALLLALRARRRTLPLLGCAFAALVIGVGWRDLEGHYSLVYLVQQAGTYAALALVFGRTLADGREPLCAHFAALVHGPLAPEVARYTRRVTQAWTVFFAVMAAALLVLFVAVPLPAWSAFANFCTLPLVGAMFAAEYAVRRRVLPNLEHRGLGVTLRAVFAGGGRPSVAAPRS
jgi:uncharacterized membrane protein